MKHGYVRPATHDEVLKVSGHFELGDIFTATELNDLLVQARLRVIGVFRHAKHTVRRRPTRAERTFDQASSRKPPPRTRLIDTDNHITGVEGKPSELAYFIQRNLRNHFITRETLCRFPDLEWALEVNENLAGQFMAKVEYKIIEAQINFMIQGGWVDDKEKRAGEIWFDQGHGGIWQIQQSVVEEHLKQRAAAREATSTKRDDRSFHGRPRKQVVDRGIPPSTSVSHAKGSTVL